MYNSAAIATSLRHYLQKCGGTLTAALTGTSASFSGNLVSYALLTVSSGGLTGTPASFSCSLSCNQLTYMHFQIPFQCLVLH